MKKQRKLVVGFLLLLALVVSGFTYAYWAGIINAPKDLVVDNNHVNIGVGKDVQTVITASAQAGTKELVPTKHIVNSGDDTETLTFSVTWAGTGSNALDAIGTTGTLSAEISNIRINEQEINADGLGGIMFEITPQPSTSITAGTPLDFTVTVVFAREPKDLETYNKVVNKAVTFTVTFTVVVTP